MGVLQTRLVMGLAAAWLVGCGSAAPGPTTWAYGERDAARDELASLIEDVTLSDGHVYDPHDDVGLNGIAGIKILQAPDGVSFIGVYFTWDEGAQEFRTYVGTSDDLLTWTRQAELGRDASQPTIAAASDGGYVVGWEQEPPNHLEFAYYPTFDDLLGGRPQKTYEPPTQLSPDCAEGTPSFYSASSTFLDVGFHYFRGCQLDRQARGTTDWTTWSSSPQPAIDESIEALGVEGGIGDRDGPFTFRGWDFMLHEGMRVRDHWETFRVFLYDSTTGSARQLAMNTHRGSRAFTNPTISQVTLDGRQAIVVSMFIPQEAGAPGEIGGVIYYRFID